jgi:hypothetical protein
LWVPQRQAQTRRRLSPSLNAFNHDPASARMSSRPLARRASNPLLCRFSDAGSDEPSTRSDGRRLKSAKARNRGEVGHRRCRGALWGFSREVRLGEVGSKRPLQSLCRAGWVWVAG